MGKDKLKLQECKLCLHSIINETNDLHCITRMKDANIFLDTSKVKVVSNCSFYKLKKGKKL